MSSSSDDQIKVTRKRYKRPLRADYKESDVNWQTHRNWTTLLQCQADTELSTMKDSSLSASTNDDLNECFGSDLNQWNSEKCSDRESSANENDLDGFLHNIDNIRNINDSESSVHNNSDENDNNDVIIEDLSDAENNYQNYSDVECNDNSDTDSIDSNFEENTENNSVLDDLMFEESKLSVRDVVTMISAFCLRFNISDEGRLQVMDIFKLCAGPKFEQLNISKYRMEQCVSNEDEHIKYYYYCMQCCNTILHSMGAADKLKTQNVICENCQSNSTLNKASPNYFMRIDLAHQLKQVLSKPQLSSDILRNLSLRHDTENNAGLITDISGGDIQQNIIRNEDSKYLILLNFSTDGAPLTKSGKNAFWALQVTINSLSPKLRYKNILIAGMLIVKREPNPSLMNLYMSTFVDQINLLYEEGIIIRIDDTDITFKFITHACPVDSVCRPVMQNRLQFNGYCGCSYCYQQGQHIPKVGIRYIVSQPSNVLRTKESHSKDINLAIENKKVMRGVKGDSVLRTLPYFDIVWSFSYDYMHGLLLGVVHQLLNEWKSGNSPYKLKKNVIEMIEKRFLIITPNQEIHRLPRSGIIVGSTKAKASELRSWLLFYSIPCLTGILHPDALNHYSLLIKSSYTLLKPQITERELLICEEDLITFVVGYEMYYGEESMTFNVHMLLHICESIRKTGLLCTNSTFPFESNIYNLKTFVNGSKGMDKQMVRKSLQTLMFKTGNISSNSENTKNFCANLFNPQRLKINNYDTVETRSNVENVTYVGKGTQVNVNNYGNCIAYKKCIFIGSVYHSTKYTRASKTNDTIILLNDDRFATILDIFKSLNDKRCYLKLSIFNVAHINPFNGIDHIKRVIPTEDFDDIVILPIDAIKKKAIVVNVNNIKYLCTLPNNIEIQ